MAVGDAGWLRRDRRCREDGQAASQPRPRALGGRPHREPWDIAGGCRGRGGVRVTIPPEDGRTPAGEWGAFPGHGGRSSAPETPWPLGLEVNHFLIVNHVSSWRSGEPGDVPPLLKQINLQNGALFMEENVLEPASAS